MTRTCCVNVTEDEIDAWVNGELPDADVERVLFAIMNDPIAAAQLEDCLQVRALGRQLRADAPAELEPRSEVGQPRVRSLRAV